MAESYCGKSCQECPQMQQHFCNGCKTVPGKKFGGDCKLAACVHEKGHETCDTCAFHTSCGKYRDRYQVPEQRRKMIEDEAARRSLIAQRAVVLGKWLWILFWLVVPSTIGSFMDNDFTAESMPVVCGAGKVIQFACNLVYGGILLKLVSEDERYLAAGVCTLIGCFAGGLTAAFENNAVLSLLIAIPVLAVALYGEYSEYMAHAAVLADVDPELSDKWTNLWNWYVGLNIGVLCSPFLVLIPVLGALILFGMAIGIIVVSVLKLVYLYQTAKAFREY